MAARRLPSVLLLAALIAMLAVSSVNAQLRMMGESEEARLDRLYKREMALSKRAFKSIGDSCTITKGNSWGGCSSSCCLNGKCAECDKCAPSPKTNSGRCRWCIKNKLPVSSSGCLLVGDTCSTRPGWGWNNKESKCSTGCCKSGKCTFCENCANGGCAGCKSKKLPTNPKGICAPKKTTKKLVATTKKSTVPTGVPGPVNAGPLWSILPQSWCHELLYVRMNGDDLQCEMNAINTGCNFRPPCDYTTPPLTNGWYTIPRELYANQATAADWAVLAWYDTHYDNCAPYCPMWNKQMIFKNGPGENCPACSGAN